MKGASTKRAATTACSRNNSVEKDELGFWAPGNYTFNAGLAKVSGFTNPSWLIAPIASDSKSRGRIRFS